MNTKGKTTASGRRGRSVANNPMVPSDYLARIIGNRPRTRSEVTKELWAYIKANDLQDRREGRFINADDNLRAVFGGKSRVSLFEMTKLVNYHLMLEAEHAAITQPDAIEDLEAAEPKLTRLAETERLEMRRSRIGQGRFRSNVVEVWGGCCSVTNLGITELLRASHIRPWRVASNRDRISGMNGLLLVPNYDQAFDRGFISFDSDGKIKIAPMLTSDVCRRLAISRRARLRSIPAPMKKHLAYHLEHVFLG